MSTELTLEEQFNHAVMHGEWPRDLGNVASSRRVFEMNKRLEALEEAAKANASVKTKAK